MITSGAVLALLPAPIGVSQSANAATGNVRPVRSPEAALRAGVQVSARATGDPATPRMYLGATLVLCPRESQRRPQ
jgi:hypothetical protein